jgi:hypothetical protein
MIIVDLNLVSIARFNQLSFYIFLNIYFKVYVNKYKFKSLFTRVIRKVASDELLTKHAMKKKLLYKKCIYETASRSSHRLV